MGIFRRRDRDRESQELEQFGALGDNLASVTRLLPALPLLMAIKNAPDTRSRILAFLDFLEFAAELTASPLDNQGVAALRLVTANEAIFLIVIAFYDRQFSAHSEGRFGAMESARFGAAEEQQLHEAGISIGVVLMLARYLPLLLAFLNQLRDGE